MVESTNEQEAGQQTRKELAVSAKCAYIHPSGRQCKANRLKGSSLCFFHSPLVTEARAEARRRGGLHRYAEGQPGNYVIESPHDVLAVLIDSLNETTALPNTCGKAKAIAGLVAVLLRGFELSEFHTRLSALEKKVWGEK
jgi:hypothetical protein